jgi:multidrug resistance efflux pump
MTEDAAQNAREERIRLRKELKHMEALVRRGEVTMDQFEEVESSYRLANEACDAAETKLEEYIIRVPWSGKVSKVWVTEGARVVPKTSLVDLYDPSSLVVRLSVPEHQISLIRTGMDVPVELDGFPGQIFYAKVSCIHPEINRTRRRATVDVVLYDNVDLLLGMNAKVKIPFAD